MKMIRMIQMIMLFFTAGVLEAQDTGKVAIRGASVKQSSGVMAKVNTKSTKNSPRSYYLEAWNSNKNYSAYATINYWVTYLKTGKKHKSLSVFKLSPSERKESWLWTTSTYAKPQIINIEVQLIGTTIDE